MRKNIEILYEDEEIIVCIKPAGLLSQPDKKGDPDLVNLLKTKIAIDRRRGGSKEAGEPYLAVIHRLDRQVRGIMVYAKTERAAAALSKELKEQGFSKTYRCVVEMDPEKPLEVTKEERYLLHYMKSEQKNNLSYMTSPSEDAKKAELFYLVSASAFPFALIEIRLLTGRKHQIRLQMAEISYGVVGDRKYHKKREDGKKREPLALECVGIGFRHPVTGEALSFQIGTEGRAFTIFE